MTNRGEVNADGFHFAAEQSAEAERRPGQAGVRIGGAALVEGVKALEEPRRSRRLAPAHGETTVGVDPPETVVADVVGHQHVADALLGGVDAEGDADAEERARPPRLEASCAASYASPSPCLLTRCTTRMPPCTPSRL